MKYYFLYFYLSPKNKPSATVSGTRRIRISYSGTGSAGALIVITVSRGTTSNPSVGARLSGTIVADTSCQ